MNARLLNLPTTLAAALLLAACGGGGGASSPGAANPGGGGGADGVGVVEGGGGAAAADATTRGAITAASSGSIVVNGVKLDLSQAKVSIDKSVRGEAELHRGMIVTVRGTFDDHGGRASEVEFEHAVRGRVEGKSGNVISVGGQIVRVDDTTEFGEDNPARLGGVAVGSVVRVSGVPDDKGGLRASRVDGDRSSSGELELKGFVSDLGANGFTLKISPDADAAGTWTVTYAAGVVLPAGLANGAFVEIHAAGPASGNAVVVNRVSLEDSFHHGRGEIEFEGIVTSGSSEAFVVAGQAVRTTPSTRWTFGVPADLLPGVKVEVEGHQLVDGVLIAEKVSYRAVNRLQGPASDVATAGLDATFTVVGVRVSASSLTDWRISPSAIAGARVQVRGYPGRDGGVIATRIESAGSDERLELRGVVTAADEGARSVTILGITGAGAREFHAHRSELNIGAAAFFSQVVPGATVVQVRSDKGGVLAGTSFAAKEMELEED